MLTGFLGTGKTTLLNHVLHNREGRRVAVIVNDMSEVNIDAALVRGGGADLSRTEEKLVEMSNGCICCTLREDLLQEVGRLAAEGRFDYLLIESTGISEPLPVAQTFTFADEAGRSFQEVTRLDTMVTVIDAANFLAHYQSGETLLDRDLALGAGDQRSIADLFADQVEFADVIVLNKLQGLAGALRRPAAGTRLHRPTSAIRKNAGRVARLFADRPGDGVEAGGLAKTARPVPGVDTVAGVRTRPCLMNAAEFSFQSHEEWRHALTVAVPADPGGCRPGCHA